MRWDEATQWAYGAGRYTLDLLDEAVARRVADCAARMGAEEDAARGVELGADFIGGFCGRLRGFFDGVLGAGAGVALLGADNNLAAAMDCYEAFMAFGARQAEAARARAGQVMALYDPARARRGDGA